jgi:protein-S-isoprenylcysteine O-methyltransferase Ste14
MGELLLLTAWAVGIFYSSIPLFWFVIHPLAARWQGMARSPYRILLPLWAVMIGALGAATWPWHALRLYSTFWTWLPAILFFVIGAGVYRRIRADFGIHNFSGESELRPQEHEQALVTTGLHTRMRHPIYFAHLSMFTAWTIGTGLLINFVLLAVNVLLTFPLMIWLEEKELEKRFGQSFLEYKARVSLIPFFVTSHAANDSERTSARRKSPA